MGDRAMRSNVDPESLVEHVSVGGILALVNAPDDVRAMAAEGALDRSEPVLMSPTIPAVPTVVRMAA